MKFEHLDFPDHKDCIIMEKKAIWKKLEKIQAACHKKFHYSYSFQAVYKAMLTRCIIHSNKTQDLIMKSAFDKMIEEYKTGKIDWPGGFSVKEFNPIAHMFVKGEISEC